MIEVWSALVKVEDEAEREAEFCHQKIRLNEMKVGDWSKNTEYWEKRERAALDVMRWCFVRKMQINPD